MRKRPANPPAVAVRVSIREGETSVGQRVAWERLWARLFKPIGGHPLLPGGEGESKGGRDDGLE